MSDVLVITIPGKPVPQGLEQARPRFCHQCGTKL
jgi:hypothetical protein